MGRALGINALLKAGFETTYGTTPAAAAFKRLPFVSSNLGEERPLIEDDQLGGGREGFDPTPDVATNDGDLVVPVDTDAFGYWLKALLGAPTTTGTTTKTHTFTSGASVLPSMSIEVGNPEVPSFAMNYGAAANQLRLSLARNGLLNATMGMICQGESDAPAAVSHAPVAALVRGPRFAQAAGEITRNGVALGGVVSSDFTFSNGLEKVETIRSDGRIEGVDPGKILMTGSTTVRFANHDLLEDATSGDPISLNFGWERGAASLIFTVPRVFLPRVKRPISGPGGVQATFNWQASGASGHTLTAVLVNEVADYA